MRRFLLFGWLMCWAILLRAQGLTEDTKTAALVDCGKEKVMTFNYTSSKDGRYALGWTLRPTTDQAPVDWSLYDSDDPGMFVLTHSFQAGDPATDKYILVNGILDLVNKRFTPLPIQDPIFPDPHAKVGFGVIWPAKQRGTSSAVVSAGGRYTWGLWLVNMDGRKVQIQDLLPVADKAVQTYVRKRHLELYQLIYEEKPSAWDPFACRVDYDLYAQESAHEGDFKVTKNFVTLPLTLGDTRRSRYARGSITFSLPRGKVIRVMVTPIVE